MSGRTNISTGTPWEKKLGYSRAVRVGNLVYISGTTSSDEAGKVIGAGNPGEQADYIFQKIERALLAAGANLQDVVRVRMFVTDISRWEEVGHAYSRYFKHVLPVTTMVEVSKLIDPEHMVEIEVDAVIGSTP